VGATPAILAVLHTWTRTLLYLARYVFRVAITNSRLEAFADGRVAFRYRDNRTQQLQRVTLGVEEFIGRFCSTFCRRVFPRCAITDWLANHSNG